MNPKIDKLIRLGAHLTKGPLSMPYVELLQYMRKQPYHKKHPPCLPFVFNELPYLFSEWEHWPFGLVIYTPQPELSIDGALPVFFGITDEVSKHLFYPDSKNVAKYGGKALNLYVRPRDVANQIYQWIQRYEEGTGDQ